MEDNDVAVANETSATHRESPPPATLPHEPITALDHVLEHIEQVSAADGDNDILDLFNLQSSDEAEQQVRRFSSVIASCFQALGLGNSTTTATMALDDEAVSKAGGHITILLSIVQLCKRLANWRDIDMSPIVAALSDGLLAACDKSMESGERSPMARLSRALVDLAHEYFEAQWCYQRWSIAVPLLRLYLGGAREPGYDHSPLPPPDSETLRAKDWKLLVKLLDYFFQEDFSIDAPKKKKQRAATSDDEGDSGDELEDEVCDVVEEMKTRDFISFKKQSNVEDKRAAPGFDRRSIAAVIESLINFSRRFPSCVSHQEGRAVVIRMLQIPHSAVLHLVHRGIRCAQLLVNSKSISENYGQCEVKAFEELSARKTKFNPNDPLAVARLDICIDNKKRYHTAMAGLQALGEALQEQLRLNFMMDRKSRLYNAYCHMMRGWFSRKQPTKAVSYVCYY